MFMVNLKAITRGKCTSELDTSVSYSKNTYIKVFGKKQENPEETHMDTGTSCETTDSNLSSGPPSVAPEAMGWQHHPLYHPAYYVLLHLKAYTCAYYLLLKKLKGKVSLWCVCTNTTNKLPEQKRWFIDLNGISSTD